MDTITQQQPWQRVAGRLVSRLHADLNHDLARSHPWMRAAHSMVEGWRIRLSRPPVKGNAPVATRPNWKVFAQRGVGILSCKNNHAHQSEWYLWATRRVTGGSRYIRKSLRTY